MFLVFSANCVLTSSVVSKASSDVFTEVTSSEPTEISSSMMKAAPWKKTVFLTFLYRFPPSSVPAGVSSLLLSPWAVAYSLAFLSRAASCSATASPYESPSSPDLSPFSVSSWSEYASLICR